MPRKDLSPQLTFVPYVKGVSEYASSVRKVLQDREGTDFILAVDLPHGLEDQVLKAVKRLPRISLIVDKLWRAIPVIPSCGSIEAVRTFLETGHDLKFIDTSLPVCGKFEEWRRFSEYCREFGQKEVVAKAEEYGIDLNELLFGKGTRTQRSRPNFMHIPGDSGSYLIQQYSPADSQYMEARHRFMAMRLQELQKERGLDIVAVCDVRNLAAVQHYLHEPSPKFDDSFIFDTVTCRVKEKDIIKISPEIPLFMHHYEVFRNHEWSREHWLQELLTGMEPAPDCLSTREIYRYSRNLALTDGQLYPGLYNLLAAAKYCAGDSYALRLLERASLYPGADQDSNCEMKFYCDYNLSPIGDARVLELRDTISDVASWKRNGVKCHGGPRRIPPPFGVMRFERSPESLQNEKDFVRYLNARYQFRTAKDDYTVEEFSCGMKDGIDERETLRHFLSDKVYVKERMYENDASYVVDFGTKSNWGVYFSRQNPIVGSAIQGTTRHCWGCFVALPKVPKPAEEYLSQNLLNRVNRENPLESCIEIGLDHASKVFVFSPKEREEILSMNPSEKHRIRAIPLQNIPEHILTSMRCFDVEA